jgi:hypothetical protein
MILKLDEGRNEVGLIKVAILIVMTVDAAKTVGDMLVRSKYWTELSVKEVTGQL